MNLTVKGKNIDIGDALKTRAAESLARIFGKYFGAPLDATVTLSKDSRQFAAHILVHVGRGILLQSEASAESANAAYDLAAENLAKRLRRHKRRLRDHQRGEANSLRLQGVSARQYVLAPETDSEEDGADWDSVSDADPVNAAPDSPVIVAETQTDIPSLTVGEAVMRLDLADQQAMMFLNRAHGGLNMVYRRTDGHIGWVDPQSPVQE
jgi:ribosomal subunit interface protein